MKVRKPCPICGELAERGSSASPFCSERCRLLDLGRWLDGDYRIPSQNEDGAEVAAEEEASRRARPKSAVDG